MNTIYKSILVLGVALISVNAVAQKADSTLTRQVLLERDYNPTLNEATKINTAPNIFSPKIQSSSSVKFINQAPQLTIGATKLGQVASGDIRTNVPFSKQRFYLNAGAGSHGNIDGTIGVRAVDTQNDKLDIFATHSSTSGNIDYAHSKNLLTKAKAKFADTKANIKFEHKFEPSILSIGASYQNMGYNYYGNPLVGAAVITDEDERKAMVDLLDMKTKQKVDVISFGVGFKSSDDNEGLLKYEAGLGYTNFTSKHGFYPAIDKGPRGGIIDANVNFYTQLGLGDIGVAGDFLNQSFSSKKDYEIAENSFKSLTNVTVNPYYRIGELSWDLNLGVNLDYVMDEESLFMLSPNIIGQFHINEVNTLYASATGGVNNNTFTDILQENRYVSPLARVTHSRTDFDIKAGFKSGIITNLEFDLFGGYKMVTDDHTYAAFSTFDFTADGLAWGNVGIPTYAKISTGHFGGLVKTSLIPKTTLTAKAVGYFYNVKDSDSIYGDKAWGRPTFTGEITADIKPIDRLTLSLNYLLMAGRKGISKSVIVEHVGDTGTSTAAIASMKDINEFNAYAEFEIIKCFSVHARVNNIFNQKYEQQFGYTLQGLNVLGGINLRF